MNEVIANATSGPSAQGLAGEESTIRETGTVDCKGELDRQLEILVSQGAKLDAQHELVKSSHSLLVEMRGILTQITEDAAKRAMRPILLDLILLYDSLQQAEVWALSEAETTSQALTDRLRVLEAELLEILARRDVHRQEETETKLDRQRHRVVKAVATTNPDEDNCIKTILRPGFLEGERVFRPSEVVISKFDATLK